MSSDSLPKWLYSELFLKTTNTDRDEIEIKLVVRKDDICNVIKNINSHQQLLEQTYTSIDILEIYISDILPDERDVFQEWRVRRNNDQFFVTGKSAKGSNIKRREFQIEIDPAAYAAIIKSTEANGSVASVGKTRLTFPVGLGQKSVVVEIDDFSQVAGDEVDLDFVYCELEVSSMALARSLQKRLISHPVLSILLRGIDVSRFNEFKNASLAENGFPAKTFSDVAAWVRSKMRDQLARTLENTPDWQLGWLDFRQNDLFESVDVRPVLEGEEAVERFRPSGVLNELRFDKLDSKGRANPLPKSSERRDSDGHGWIRDYQTIVSSDPFLRLFSKPQIFRPGLGHSNTTTRGQHTLDVISCAQSIATQTGLNSQLAGAIAALHDVGHPAGGHVGEEILTELSKEVFDGAQRRFKHHIFSLSLADIFEFNLLREVQVGAFYHKSGGQKLEAPLGRPQEFGVVRIADKLSYVPWDVHDSIRNGFLDNDDIPMWIYDVLGKDPMDWVETMTTATIEESAGSFGISFSEASGDVYKAYAKAREIVYGKVHGLLTWDVLKVQYRLVFKLIRSSFPDMDPIPILAYMTDDELSTLSTYVEARPSNTKRDIPWFEEQGMGFIDIVKKMQNLTKNGTYSKNVYYHSVDKQKLH